MLAKGSLKAQIASGAENSAIEVREQNRRVIMKLIKTVYFMAQKKWAVKNNFKDVAEFVKDLGDADLEKHFRDMGKNATYLSTTPVDEFIHIISDFIEKKICLMSYHLKTLLYLLMKALMGWAGPKCLCLCNIWISAPILPRKNLFAFANLEHLKHPKLWWKN